jgi:hypothetical protein
MSDPNEDFEQQMEQLQDQFHEAEDDKSRIAVLEEMIRKADAANDIYWGYGLRMELIEIATFGGYKEKGLVAFSWCLAQLDKNPDEFDEHDVLWKFKWMLEQMPNYATIDNQKIAGLQDDMARRLQQSGYSPRPVHYLRWSNAMRMGDFEKAQAEVELWKSSPRDELADCEACEEDKYIEWLGRTNQSETAVQKAEELMNGRMSCAEVPELTFGHIIRSYWRLGRVRDLKSKQKRWYRRIKDNREFLAGAAEHLLFVSATGDLPTAISMFEHHAPWISDTTNEDHKYRFYAAASVLFDKLANESPDGVKVRLPKEFACFREDSRYSPGELSKWFRQEAESLAGQFNQRNGNEYYTALLTEADDLVQSLSV